MSLAAFAYGLNEGVDAGVKLGTALNTGINNTAMRQMGDVFAQASTASPWESGAPDENSPGGFDGVAYDKLKGDYLKAASRLTDPQLYLAAEDKWAKMEQGRQLEMLDAAIMAQRAGNPGLAAKYMAGASYFIEPGSTPNVSYDEASGAYQVETPRGGYALTPQNLEDVRFQISDYSGWQNHMLAEQKFKSEAGDRAARLAIAQTKAALEQEKLQLEVDAAALANQEAAATSEARVGATNAGFAATEAANLAAIPLAGRAAEADVAGREATANLTDAQAQNVLDDLGDEEAADIANIVGKAFTPMTQPPSDSSGGDYIPGLGEEMVTAPATGEEQASSDGAESNALVARAYDMNLALVNSDPAIRTAFERILTGIARDAYDEGEPINEEFARSLMLGFATSLQGYTGASREDYGRGAIVWDPTAGGMSIGGVVYQIDTALGESVTSLLAPLAQSNMAKASQAPAIPEPVSPTAPAMPDANPAFGIPVPTAQGASAAPGTPVINTGSGLRTGARAPAPTTGNMAGRGVQAGAGAAPDVPGFIGGLIGSPVKPKAATADAQPSVAPSTGVPLTPLSPDQKAALNNARSPKEFQLLLDALKQQLGPNIDLAGVKGR